MPARRFLPWLLLFLPLTGLTGEHADRGDTLAEAREAGEATVTVLYVPAGGWAYREGDGELTGVTVEIMRRFADYVAEARGIELELDFVEETDWTVFYGRVRDAEGGVFGIGNVTITEPRREELAFSPPYLENIAVLITHEDRGKVDGPEQAARQLADLRALAFEGTLHETRLKALRDEHWPELGIDCAGSNDEIITAVADDTHFAYIDAYNYYGARDRGAPLRHHPAFDDTGEQFGVIMPLNNDWQQLVDEFFAHDGGLMQRDFYRELLAEHLGEAVADLLTGQ
ncbi:transporter substrate-binding domain-containing protein [Wenzhouxiangella sp. AB-CW3]|uniref:substrate-binding periplasmic protein n=1 Tax=Wenzhouxiangella sp. AB-CW3 TaxID=2771012 RepID=UPI00168BEE79|nr:transporter substrate-binding domain-containing protein [Wenzhouxiangella sp. AB-CW3]QOC22645.1 transporter substrate-binding domain-containing protein [Wenzhouxiangella sp. AB-CW3]